MRLESSVKAEGRQGVRNLRVQTGSKAGKLCSGCSGSSNHNPTGAGALRVRSGVRAGGRGLNHNQAVQCLRVQTGSKAGKLCSGCSGSSNHNQTVARRPASGAARVR